MRMRTRQWHLPVRGQKAPGVERTVGKVGGVQCEMGGGRMVARRPDEVGWNGRNNGTSCPPRKCVRYKRGKRWDRHLSVVPSCTPSCHETHWCLPRGRKWNRVVPSYLYIHLYSPYNMVAQALEVSWLPTQEHGTMMIIWRELQKKGSKQWSGDADVTCWADYFWRKLRWSKSAVADGCHPFK